LHKELLGDKAYDSNSLRKSLRKDGIRPVTQAGQIARSVFVMTSKRIKAATSLRSTSHDDSQDSVVGLIGWVNAKRQTTLRGKSSSYRLQSGNLSRIGMNQYGAAALHNAAAQAAFLDPVVQG
jgi:hypothetical protein